MHGRRRFLQTIGRTAAGTGLGLLALREGVPRLPPPDAPDFWDIVRAQYPLTHDRAYFNAGGLGPAPYVALDAAHRTTLDLQAISETGHAHLDEVREPVAAFLGADPSEIAFTRNATEGNATVASGLALQAGDEVIFESHAHPGGSYPWLNRQKQDGVRVKIFDPDPTSAAGNVDRIAALITPRTRVVQVSHVTAPTGIRMPVQAIAALAHDRGCWFHVDGAQSAGQIPVDLHAVGCDSYATSGHKWMGAPHGTGVLYVRHDRLDAVRPTETGAYGDDGSVRLPDRFGYHPSARRYEVGTRAAAPVVGMAAAVAFLEQIGMDRVAERTQHLARYLQHQLRAMPGVEVLTPEDPSLSAAMTTLRLGAVPFDRLNRYYAEHGLRCRPVQEQGLNAVRVSTHIYNSEAECDRVVAATRAALEDA